MVKALDCHAKGPWFTQCGVYGIFVSLENYFVKSILQ